MKTTIAGVLTAIGAVVTAVGKALGDGFQVDDIAIIAAAAAAAWGLLMAEDAPKKSKHWPDQR